MCLLVFHIGENFRCNGTNIAFSQELPQILISHSPAGLIQSLFPRIPGNIWKIRHIQLFYRFALVSLIYITNSVVGSNDRFSCNDFIFLLIYKSHLHIRDTGKICMFRRRNDFGVP